MPGLSGPSAQWLRLWWRPVVMVVLVVEVMVVVAVVMVVVVGWEDVTVVQDISVGIYKYYYGRPTTK